MFELPCVLFYIYYIIDSSVTDVRISLNSFKIASHSFHRALILPNKPKNYYYIRFFCSIFFWTSRIFLSKSPIFFPTSHIFYEKAPQYGIIIYILVAFCISVCLQTRRGDSKRDSERERDRQTVLDDDFWNDFEDWKSGWMFLFLGIFHIPLFVGFFLLVSFHTSLDGTRQRLLEWV